MDRLTDRPDMTLVVYRGRKTTTQQQQQLYRVFLEAAAQKIVQVVSGSGILSECKRRSPYVFDQSNCCKLAVEC